MKNLSEYLSPEYSWWMIIDGGIARVNETEPTAENLRFIFFCEEGCEQFHVAEMNDIRLHEDGDYDFCCPEQGLEELQQYLGKDNLPEELEEIFKTASFEKNYIDEDEED